MYGCIRGNKEAGREPNSGLQDACGLGMPRTAATFLLLSESS